MKELLEKLLKESDNESRLGQAAFADGMRYVVKRISEAVKSDDWIPVGDRLPEEDGRYLVSVHGEVIGQDYPFTGIQWFCDGAWTVNGAIAWKPLPEPCRASKSSADETGDIGWREVMLDKFLGIGRRSIS